MTEDAQRSLETLKALLVGNEQTAIKRLEDPEVQAERVAESLPDSILRAQQQTPGELRNALRQPVSGAIEEVVRGNPGMFASILYPVMGPAIRRAIGQAFRDLTQQINQAIEHSVTLKGLAWRIEAARSGLPFAEVVLRHTLRYRVDEAFLIHQEDGLLIAHASARPDGERDADAISAMLTAIRDFANDTLENTAGQDQVETVDSGEHSLWLVNGPHAYLALAVRGVPPVGLRDEFSDRLEQMHARHPGLLREFAGNQDDAIVLQPDLQACLRSELREEDKQRRAPWPLLLALLVLLGIGGWFAYRGWLANQADAAAAQRRAQAVEALRDTPGVVITGARDSGDRVLVEGLRDSLAARPEAILQRAGMADVALQADLSPYQSPAPQLALQRARQRLAAPGGIELQLADGVLSARGVAPAEWIANSHLLAVTVPGIDAYDASAVLDTDEALRRTLQERLQPPAGVELQVRDGIAMFKGVAPLAWIRGLEQHSAGIAGLRGLVSTQLVAHERRELDRLKRQIDRATIRFTDDISLAGNATEKLRELVAQLQQAAANARVLNRTLGLVITGRTDSIGSPAHNLLLAQDRAAFVAQRLQSMSDKLPQLYLQHNPASAEITQVNPELRRVEFRLIDTTQAPAPEGNGR